MDSPNEAGSSRVSKAVRTTGGGVARAVTVLLLVYLAAALAGSLLPANSKWQEPDRGIRIFVYTNAVHTGILVPATNGIHDWRGLVKAEHLADPRYAASSHILFGWGERDFYLNTPTWGDMNLLTVLKAVVYGRRTLLHVDFIHDPKPGRDMRPIMVSEDQYRQLSQRIEEYFRFDAQGRPRPIEGYGPADVFYEATGQYNFVQTCNEWTGKQLREIGVEIGQWTPFSQSVMIWFDEKRVPERGG